ncbi:MAG: hypothetical protein K2Q22_16780, partial [Cytophagales bacterium]|nr:hypothetical protein [Cytophagales bacterium]
MYVEDSLDSKDANFIHFPYQQTDKSSFRFGYNYRPHWLRLNLKNETDSKSTYFLVAENPTINILDFYQYQGGRNSIVQNIKTGIDYPFSQRGFPNREFVFDMELEPKEQYSLYIKCHNHLSNLAIPLRLYTHEGFYAQERMYNLFWKSYFGFILISACTALVLFVFFREWVYVLYAAYLFFFFMFQLCMEGFAYQYLWPESPWLAEMSKLIFVFPGLILCAHFILHVISDADHPLKRHKMITHVLSVLLASLLFIKLIFDPSIEVQRTMVRILNTFYVCLLITFLHAILIRTRDRYKPAIYVLIALLPLMVIMVLAILKNFGIIPHFAFFTYIFPIVSSFEILVFFVALSERFRLEKRERTLMEKRFRHYENLISEWTKVGPKEGDKKHYSTSVIPDEELEENYRKTITYILENKAYLDPELSLTKLSSSLNISLHELSQTINRKENRNFNEFINYFRIMDAKEKLLDPNLTYLSVEGIGAECGFSTKTTFYNAF